MSGTRADELGNRLKYAGLDPARIQVVGDPVEALARGMAATDAATPLTIVAGYTPMIEMREAMQRRGWVGRYWEVPP